MLDQVRQRQAVTHEVSSWSAPATGPSDEAIGSRLLDDQHQAHRDAVARMFPPQDEHDVEDRDDR